MGVSQQIWINGIIGICYWFVKIPQCGCMERGLKHITFDVQKHIAHLARCSNRPLVRDKPLGAPESLKLVYCSYLYRCVYFEWHHKKVGLTYRTFWAFGVYGCVRMKRQIEDKWNIGVPSLFCRIEWRFSRTKTLYCIHYQNNICRRNRS